MYSITFVIFSVAKTISSVIGRFLASKTASKGWKININSHSWPFGHSMAIKSLIYQPFEAVFGQKTADHT